MTCLSDARRPIIEASTVEVSDKLGFFYGVLVSERGGVVDNSENRTGKNIMTVAEWLTTPGRPWLFLSGNVGTGKTTLLKAIGKTLDYYRVTRKLFPASDFPALWRDNQEIVLRSILGGDWCHVLLLDDIGVESPVLKEYGNEIRPFVKIIEGRYNRQLPLVVSTNLSGSEMATTYGERTIDRICEMSCAIRYEGKSFRKSTN